MPTAFLLSERGEHKPDAVPGRLHLPVPRNVYSSAVQPRYLRVLRRQGPLRLVPVGSLLPHATYQSAVSCGELLPQRGVVAPALPGGVVLPSWSGDAHQLPLGHHIDGRRFQQAAVQLSEAAVQPVRRRSLDVGLQGLGCLCADKRLTPTLLWAYVPGMDTYLPRILAPAVRRRARRRCAVAPAATPCYNTVVL